MKIEERFGPQASLPRALAYVENLRRQVEADAANSFEVPIGTIDDLLLGILMGGNGAKR